MGAWYMNSDGGAETDRSGENGTLTQESGTIPTSATVPSGYSGTSRDFVPADTEYLNDENGGSTDINGADQDMSLCGWFKTDDNDNDQVIVGKYNDSGGNNKQYLIKYKGGGTDDLEFRLSADGSNHTTAVGPSTITDTNWHHFCAVYDDENATLYIDKSAGTPVSHTTGIFNGTAPFRIGQYQNENYFDGLIDEIIIFDKALSAAEVADLYNDGISGDTGGSD